MLVTCIARDVQGYICSGSSLGMPILLDGQPALYNDNTSSPAHRCCVQEHVNAKPLGPSHGPCDMDWESAAAELAEEEASLEVEYGRSGCQQA